MSSLKFDEMIVSSLRSESHIGGPLTFEFQENLDQNFPQLCHNGREVEKDTSLPAWLSLPIATSNLKAMQRCWNLRMIHTNQQAALSVLEPALKVAWICLGDNGWHIIFFFCGKNVWCKCKLETLCLVGITDPVDGKCRRTPTFPLLDQ